jgi:hypothetical protein
MGVQLISVSFEKFTPRDITPLFSIKHRENESYAPVCCTILDQAGLPFQEESAGYANPHIPLVGAYIHSLQI